MSAQIRPLHSDELEQWFEHVDSVFTRTPRGYFEDHWFCDPRRDLGSVLVAVEDERIVSTVRVFWRDAWVNGVPLVFGGIGEVSTHPSYRRRGYSGAILQEALGLMRRRRAAFSVLFTDTYGHYSRFGWRKVPFARARIPEGAFRTETELQRARGNSSVRQSDWSMADIERMKQMHEATSQSFNGAVRRDTAYWMTWLRAEQRRWSAHLLVAERDGDPVAYGLFTQGSRGLAVLDFGAIGDGSGLDSRAALYLLAARAGELMGYGQRFGGDFFYPAPIMPVLPGGTYMIERLSMYRAVDAGALWEAGIQPVEEAATEEEALTIGLCCALWGGRYPDDEDPPDAPGKHLLWPVDGF